MSATDITIDETLDPARINVPLLRKVMEHIEAHPEEWDQETWVSTCETKACFAGWACWLSGVGMQAHGGLTVTSDGDPVPRAAAELLGLDRETAWDMLFDGHLTMADLRCQVDRLIALAEGGVSQ